MSFGDRLGLVGLVLSLIALAAPYLWPDKKLIGWVSLSGAIALLLTWGWLEIGAEVPRLRSQYPIKSAIVVFIVGGCLAVALWMLVQTSPRQQLVSHPPPDSPPVTRRVENVAPESHVEKKHSMSERIVKSSPIPSIKQGAGSALSINQQGGITAGTIGTVNVGPPPLVINHEQQDHLTASLRPFASQFSEKKINISLHNATNETAEFGSGLDAAFRAAGFQTNTGPVSFIGAVLSRGVTIRFGTNRTKIAEAVRDSLLSNKVVHNVYQAPGLDDDDFLIIVAP
jgi:hypothetical protein